MKLETGNGARSRQRVALVLLTVIALGLGSRSGHAWIPGWLSANAGDGLWAMAVYCALALLRPGAPPRILFTLALTISFSVELSQLWRAAWLEDLRRTLSGRLLLGAGWEWADLLRYTVGAALAWSVDCRVLRSSRE